MIKKTYAEIKRVPDAEDLLQKAKGARDLLYTALENAEDRETRERGIALLYVLEDALDELVCGLQAHEEIEHRETHIGAIKALLETPAEERNEWDARVLRQKGLEADGRSAGEIAREYADEVRRREIVITY